MIAHTHQYFRHCTQLDIFDKLSENTYNKLYLYLKLLKFGSQCSAYAEAHIHRLSVDQDYMPCRRHTDMHTHKATLEPTCLFNNDYKYPVNYVKLYLPTNCPPRISQSLKQYYLEASCVRKVDELCLNRGTRSRMEGLIGHISGYKLIIPALLKRGMFNRPPLKMIEVWIDLPSARHIASIQKLVPLLEQYSSIRELRVLIRSYSNFITADHLFVKDGPESELLTRILDGVGFVRSTLDEARIKNTENRLYFVFVKNKIQTRFFPSLLTH